MTKTILAIAASACVLASASAASADCDVGRLVVVSAAVSLDYDGFAPSDLSAPVLSGTIPDAGCADSRVTFEFQSLDGRSLSAGEGLELRNGADTLVARVSGEGDAARAAMRDGRIQARLDGVGAPPIDSLTLNLSRGQRVPPGSYQGQFRLVALAYDDRGTVVSRSEDVVVIDVRVRPSVGLSAAWGTELDLGTIASNGRALAPLRFRAYANTRYEITLTSDHDFNLIRPGRAVGLPIAYTPILSGQAMQDGAERGADFVAPPTASGFTDHTLDVVVPSLALRPAGDYEDYITVTIRPGLS